MPTEINPPALGDGPRGEVAEWLKAHAWKVCLRESVTRVRIPLSPPSYPMHQFIEAFQCFRQAHPFCSDQCLRPNADRRPPVVFRRTAPPPPPQAGPPVALPSHQQALRAHLAADHDEPGLRRLAAGLRRRQDDHRHARSADASLRYRRNRQYELPVQKSAPAPPRGVNIQSEMGGTVQSDLTAISASLALPSLFSDTLLKLRGTKRAIKCSKSSTKV